MTTPELVALVLRWVVWLYRHACPAPDDPANLAHLIDVLTLRAFAGQYWTNATTGLAQWWAILIDNLIDLIDPSPSLRGDH